MKTIIRLNILALILTFNLIVQANDTLSITNYDEYNIYKFLSYYEDVSNKLSIDHIISNKDPVSFQPLNKDQANFKYSPSTYWLKLVFAPNAEPGRKYFLEIANPDLDFIDFYEAVNDSIVRTVKTGELRDAKTRELWHRNFIFRITPNPGTHYTYYIKINNSGHALLAPISLSTLEKFKIKDYLTEIINWLISGLFALLIFASLYLYFSIKDKLNLYYSLYLFFAAAHFFTYDGYHYLLNPGILFEKTKYIYSALYLVFFLSFAKTLLSKVKKLPEKTIRGLKIIQITCPLVVVFYPFKYPVGLLTDFGIMLLILFCHILIIVLVIKNYKSNYLPSNYLLFAYNFIFLALLIHILKEAGILPSVYIVENATKIGILLECLFLTMATFELNKKNQKIAKRTINDHLKHIEAQNKELEIINAELEKLSIVARETDNSIAIYNETGRIEWANSVFEKYYDVTLKNLLKTKHVLIENIIPNKNVRMYFESCLNTNKPVQFETYVRKKGKKSFWVQTTITPYRQNGKLQKLIAVGTNISKLKKYERNLEAAMKKAEESDNLKSAFLTNMSHEIRTPLNGIIGFTELMEMENLTEEKKKRYLSVIKTNGAQLTRIIDDIIDISMIELGQLKLNIEVFSFSDMMDKLVEFFSEFRQAINKTHIDFFTENYVTPDQDNVKSDKLRIVQVLTNLIKNGFKFTDKGFVKLKCIIDKDILMICVEDSGIGIEPEQEKYIFERFRQGDETLSRRFGGTGLGLSVSKGIVEKLHGNIWFDPSYKDGARFCVNVPIK